MRHVGARLAAQIVLQHGPQLHADGVQHLHGAAVGHMLGMAQHKLQHVVDRALLDHQAFLHEHLAKVQVGVAQQVKHRTSVGKSDARLRLAAVTKDQRLGGRCHHFKLTGFHQRCKGTLQTEFDQRVKHGGSCGWFSGSMLRTACDSARCAPPAAR
ncbi:hypothetical protein SDC9_87033 [bioreactor metagenome]|uniref:Uncharacterized protein n=1 Tax=bioreactor metagenome TaxID=1076179 RepID=A0A644ZNX2_9ZZZZ